MVSKSRSRALSVAGVYPLDRASVTTRDGGIKRRYLRVSRTNPTARSNERDGRRKRSGNLRRPFLRGEYDLTRASRRWWQQKQHDRWALLRDGS